MANDTPTRQEWERLYRAAIEVKKLAPWEQLTEDWIFGVQNPETEELGFVSIMGNLGEHLAVALYQGDEGLYGFWAMHNQGSYFDPELILMVPQLQASFEDRKELHNRDRAQIKELGLKFRGRQAWPMFRSYRPGYMPWFMEADEVRFLTYALEQVLDVAPRIEENPDLIDDLENEEYLVRVAKKSKGELAWTDKTMRVPPPGPRGIHMPMDMEQLQKAAELPRVENVIAMDFFLFPTPFQEEKGERPSFAYTMLIVESESGMVLGTDLLPCTPSPDDAWGQVPLKVVELFNRIEVVPLQVHTIAPMLANLLQPLAEELDFKVRLVDSLPTLEEAKSFMMQRFE